MDNNVFVIIAVIAGIILTLGNLKNKKEANDYEGVSTFVPPEPEPEPEKIDPCSICTRKDQSDTNCRRCTVEGKSKGGKK